MTDSAQLNTCRQTHASVDFFSRRRKAEKIARLLALHEAGPPLNLLEVGTGSGLIASYFANLASREFEVHAVDVADSLQVHDEFSFSLISGTALPFPDSVFDVVISNHVIEHVGDLTAQQKHLDEMRRVTKADGIAYLAVPSRWQIIEPHYRLAFLSWLPEELQSVYLRLFRNTHPYDCRPLTVPMVELMLDRAGFQARQQVGEALRATFEIEAPRSLLYRILLKRIPDPIYSAFRRLFPTLIYVMRPSTKESATA